LLLLEDGLMMILSRIDSINFYEETEGNYTSYSHDEALHLKNAE
jgi:hypothetical protein